MQKFYDPKIIKRFMNNGEYRRLELGYQLARAGYGGKKTNESFLRGSILQSVLGEGFYAFNEKYQTVKSPTVNNLPATPSKSRGVSIKLFGFPILEIRR